MRNNVRHGKRLYKQMALEVAVRNPERYEGILKTFAKFEGTLLDDKGILKIYAQLFLDKVITANSLEDKELTPELLHKWIKENCSHNNEWGYPTGYQAAFTRYLKTLSEFGFIYAQYCQPLLLSPIAQKLINGTISLSEAFAVQCMRFWRKSPYRRVLNDFNFFQFIIDSLIKLKEQGHQMSYNQFLVGLFSDNGNVNEFIQLLKKAKIGAEQERAYSLVKQLYNQIDNEHDKVSKINTAFRDYGNTVFRVLQLTGFITIEYKGIILLSPNQNRINFYQALKSMNFNITKEAKEDEKAYFELLGSFNSDLEQLIISSRQSEQRTITGYKSKIQQIINSYGLDKKSIEQALLKVSSGEAKGYDKFWFIQAPVKFEFLLTIFTYFCLGDKYEYKPNYLCDEAGIPYSHAPGNIGDIEIYNKDTYWLIEATLIRSKIQQINNETINLFRHIDNTKNGNKYLTLVAPYIHEDTELIYNVASVITMLKKNMLSLSSNTLSTQDFIDAMEKHDYFSFLHLHTQKFINELKNRLNSISLSDNDLLQKQ